MKLLVTTSRSLLLFDTASGSFRPVHRGAGLYYGITETPRHYLVAARRRMVSSDEPAEGERGEILVFNRRLEHLGSWEPPFALRDVHEIKWHRRHLWVTCSHDNMLAVRTPDGRWQQWYPLGEPPGPHRDVNHFNSLYLRGDSLWVLAHNRGPSEILRFDLATRTLHERLPLGRQAHNLWRVGGRWHTCSSGDGTVVAEGGLCVPTGGFPRGIARLARGWAVGISELAERSRRDFSAGSVALYDDAWLPLGAHPLHGEGLVLDLLPHRGTLAAAAHRALTTVTQE